MRVRSIIRVRNIMRMRVRNSIMRVRKITRARSIEVLVALVDGILIHIDCLFLALSKAKEYRMVG